MKEYWRKFASIIDQRSTRERVLILVTSSLVVLVLLQALLLAPNGAARKRIVQETRNDQAEMGKTAAQVHSLVRDKTTDPDAAMKARLAELELRQAALQRQIDAQSAELVPPERIRAVLDKILANNSRLQLIEMKTLPRVSISVDKEAATGDKGAQARDSKPAPADERKAAEIYRHGVEVTMRGSYLDLLAYLRAIESLQARMFWDRVNLSVTAYPTVTMRLVVYTISLDKIWLTV
jgi:MSHA biogenesis protein MshJ